jgi:hypothetical protein
MSRHIFSFIIIFLVLFIQGGAYGAQIGTSLVTFNFQAIDELEVTDGPTLIIDSAVAGKQPQPVSDNTSRYSISTNGTNKRITASINKPMPANTTLEIRLAVPGSGTTLGYRTLSTTPVEVVTGISYTAAANKTIIYRFSATTDAGVLSDSCTVTLTLSD